MLETLNGDISKLNNIKDKKQRAELRNYLSSKNIFFLYPLDENRFM